jgi:dTDP-4-amino-4,6-dideoxygalactose transaminase
MRMTEIDAAIGIVQLGKLTSSNERRAATAAAYNTAFAGISGLVLPLAPPGLDHSWYQYTVRVLGGNTREALIGHLDARGVDTGIYYPQTLPEIALFAGARHPKLVRAQAAAREVLSLPVHPWVGEKERARVVEGVRTFFEPD